jgi:hypothetical protein
MGALRARRERHSSPPGLVLRVSDRGSVAFDRFPDLPAFGRRAADLLRRQASREGRVSQTTLAALDAVEAVARNPAVRPHVTMLTMAGAPVPGMIHTALTCEAGPLSNHQVADLCGLTAFALSLDREAYRIDEVEAGDWSRMGSTLAVALAGAREVTPLA